GSQNIKTGTVRFVNAIPDSVALNVAIEKTAFARVGFNNASARTPITARKLRVDVLYQDANGASVTLINKDHVTVREDRNLAVYLTGPVATPQLWSVDTAQIELAAGRAEISFVHVATALNDIEVFLTEPATDISAATPSATLDLRESVAPTDIATGDYRLRLRAAGSTTLLFDSGTFSLTDQSRIVFAVIDYFGPGSSPVRAIRIDTVGTSIFPASATPAAVSVTNLAADTLSVDASFSSTAGSFSIDDVDYPAGSATTTTPAATYDTTVIADDNGAAIVAQGSQLIAPSETRTLVLLGTALSGYQNRFIVAPVRPVANEATVRVIHAAPVAASVDFYLVPANAGVTSNVPMFTALPILTSAELTMLPGSYDAVFTTATTKDIVAGPLTVNLTARSLNTIYSHDAIGGGAPGGVIIEQATP
ncbi:MAG: DUF4397 domain-containing protein, partial [Gammaproteobacteria bacterium]|nr:DUF4397 domain-containing protein [Gammaproteobacteria bacterium]